MQAIQLDAGSLANLIVVLLAGFEIVRRLARVETKMQDVSDRVARLEGAAGLGKRVE